MATNLTRKEEDWIRRASRTAQLASIPRGGDHEETQERCVVEWVAQFAADNGYSAAEIADLLHRHADRKISRVSRLGTESRLDRQITSEIAAAGIAEYYGEAP